jgi:phage/plasmid-associated DNA primase
MKVLLGDYFEYVSPIILTEDPKKKSSAQANPEMAKLSKMRYVVCKEPPKNQPIHNNVMKDLTGGGEVQARMLYASACSVKLHLTFVGEMNKRPPFAEEPTQADADRIVDILFPSHFTDKKEEWNADKFIFPIDPSLKSPEWKHKHKNAFMNMLIMRLMEFQREDNMIIDRHIPECVKVRSLEYLLESYEIHQLFISMFEKRREEVAYMYTDEKDQPYDSDFTLPNICAIIRASKDFSHFPRKMQKEMSADAIKDFFRTNHFYKNDVEINRKKKQELLRGWRMKIPEARLEEALSLKAEEETGREWLVNYANKQEE